jgi:uncharacterized membrane protein YjjP (DUF1212 family)
LDPAPARVDEATAALPARLATALLESGASVHTTEGVVCDAARHLAVPVQAIVAPSTVATAVGEPPAQRVTLVRCGAAALNVGQLVWLASVVRALRGGTLDPAAALRRLDEIARIPPIAPAFLTPVTFALFSLANCIMLGGGWPEFAAASAVGLAAGVVVALAARASPDLPLVNFFAAAVATVVGIAASFLIGPFATNIAVAAGLIAIYPGYLLFLGVSDTTHEHAGAGTERIVTAVTTLIELGAGVAVGAALIALAPPLAHPPPPTPAPQWMMAVSLLCYVPALVVAMNARRADLPWLIVSLLTGAGGAMLGRIVPDGLVATFLGAVLLGSVCQLMARRVGLPPTLLMLPGLRSLLPGALAFNGVLHLLVQNVSGAVDLVFRASLTLVLISAGLMTAQGLFGRRTDSPGKSF